MTHPMEDLQRRVAELEQRNEILEQWIAELQHKVREMEIRVINTSGSQE